MKNFYYVHTGHRIGLDRFRRAVAIVKKLQESMEITLLCSDFRIASEFKKFGVKLTVGIDVVRNIPQITHHGDRLIFDSDEANPLMLEDMKKYFSEFIHINNAEPIVDDKYFENTPKTIPLAFFFGDDDYSKDLEKNLSILEGLNPELLLGYYYFFDYEDMLREKFNISHDYEDYDDVIRGSEILITSSPQAVLECLASAGKPIYLQREDYTEEYQELFRSLNIPIVKNYDKNHLSVILETLSTHKYQHIEKNFCKFPYFINN